ncbi:MAG: aminotransferase class I/II-fold pyridoxal phosphate-dependent enzyme [Solirubrobacteraceae bacterium]
MTDLRQPYRIRARSAATLVEEVESAVATGTLAPGQPLPSVRRLAADVGLSPATVAAALAELRRRGVVVSEPRRGTRVGERPPLETWLVPAALPAGARDLSLGNPDPALLPDPQAVLSGLPIPKRLYGESPELPELLATGRALLGADGVPAEHLCVVGGALDGIERVLHAHLRPGDRVAVEDPGYAALYDLLRADGLGLHPVEVDARGMVPASLRQALDAGVGAVVVTPRGQNPTGAAFDAQRAAALRAVLAEHPHALLLEDDHLGPVAGAPLHSLAAATRRWASARSVAKSLGPDLRLALLSGDAGTIARVRGRQSCGPGWVSHVLQRIVLALWCDREVQGLVGRAALAYAARRERLLEDLRSRGIGAHGSSGFNVWVPCGDEAGLLGALAQRGWVLAPGARYRLQSAVPAVRITAATLAAADSARLATDIAELLVARQPSRAG